MIAESPLAVSTIDSVDADAIIAATRTWLERAVIGLNLCPFAKSVHVNRRVRYCVSRAQYTDELLEDLAREEEPEPAAVLLERRGS